MQPVRWDLLTFSFVLCMAVQASGQGYKAHWIFGHGYHMEFVGGVPTMRPKIEGFNAQEGPSTVSDSDGNLLFYTNVESVFNAAHEPLLNSEGITTPTGTTLGSTITNGSLFVPWPGDSLERFYALCLIDWTDGKLRISLIDRSLDGGLGGVVPTMKNFFESPVGLGEQIAAVRHGNGRDWWIVGRRKVGFNTRGFLAFLLTPNGIDTIIESPHIEASSTLGELVFSQDGERMAYAGYTGLGSPWVGYYSFDRCNGVATLLDSIGRLNNGDEYYGVAFDSSGSNLYATANQTHTLYELSIDADTLTPNLMFRVHLGGLTIGNSMGALELGPDNRIYSSRRAFGLLNVDTIYGWFLGSINATLPYNLAYDTFAILLPDTINTTLSLPQFPNYDLGPLIGSACDSLSPPVDTTSFIGTQPAAPEWSVHPTIGRGLYNLMELPVDAQVAVFDGLGRRVQWQTVPIEATQLDLQHLPPGPYWLVARSREGAYLGVRRVVLHP